MSNTYNIITNSPNEVPWRFNNQMYSFTGDRTIQDNIYFTLEWSQADEWFRFVPKAALNATNVNFFFTLDRPARITHNDDLTAATGVDIWINDDSTVVPTAGNRFNAGANAESQMHGYFQSVVKNFTYFYKFASFGGQTVAHEYFEALDNIIT